MGFTFLAFAERERLQARRRKETTPERDACLDDQRDRAQARRCRETTSEREMRQEQDCGRYHASRQIDHSTPLFGQPAVRQKMRSFHSALVAAQFHQCDICLEKFPSVSIITRAEGSGQCRKCFMDKHIPKVYSPANNIDPGAVPPLECHARKCLSPPPSLKCRILVYQETPSHKVVALYFSTSKLKLCHKQHVVVARSEHAQCL